MENKTTNNPDFLSDKEQDKDTKIDSQKQALKPVIEDLSDPKTIISHIKNITLEEQKSIFSATELLNRKIDKIPCLLDPVFPKVGVCGFAGSSDTGKSSFLRQFAISVSLGEEQFLGFDLCLEHKKAIYVSTEDDDFAISYLLSKANIEKQLKSEDYNGLTFVFDTNNLIETLEKQLNVQKVDLIIIDTFTDIYGKSMNDTNQIRTFLNQFSQLAQRHKCLIIFLHHTGKRTEDLAPSKNNLLGSQGFEAKMRLVIELRTDKVEPQKKHLCIVKGNYLPKEYKTESFVMEFNENLMFKMTDERIPFEELKAGNNQSSIDIVKKLKAKGKTQTQIAKITGISQSTISRYLKKS